ncbi:cell division ATP-binding protein FtsE [Ligilactobacillus ceti]|uniref:Cell division ATP-binding protein FtsE n=1 Tax=Ligilactobacillus ceti DSM 22408 TaxID=1122146 RepID=A0A0R2KRD7_9LACO|nr:cell division ATP-binding protein FtsE [Ligilactobacillus ceti]KRN90326.1 cell division ATP-binding protein FtsE [Ligilactobacillus ceti DSM 22408]
MIEFKNVVKRYSDDVCGANQLTVKIEQGEFVYIVGQSGAGKSTFIELMYREEKATSGHIKINNYVLENIADKDVPYLRRELGIIFQDYKLLPRLTVFENIAYAMYVIETEPEEVEKRVTELLDMVGLADKRDNFPDELSGGEQQRVSIARAIANKPKIVIADEPTGNLDPATSDDIMNILEEINAEGTTIVMATHNNQIVDEYKHRVLEIAGGKIVRDEEGGIYTNEQADL